MKRERGGKYRRRYLPLWVGTKVPQKRRGEKRTHTAPTVRGLPEGEVVRKNPRQYNYIIFIKKIKSF